MSKPTTSAHPKGGADFKSGTWVDEITDSESEEVMHSSQTLNCTNSEEDLYLELIKKDIACKSDKNEAKVSSEDEKVNRFLDDIERQLEQNTKKNDKTKWNVIDEINDIICVKEIKKPQKRRIFQREEKKPTIKRKIVNIPVESSKIKKKKRHGRNVTLSDGEILSEEELILSDLSMSPDNCLSARTRRNRPVELSRRSPDTSRSDIRVTSRGHSRRSRSRDKRRRYDSIESSDYLSSPPLDHRRKNSRETLHSRHSKPYSRSQYGYSDHRRYHSSPDTHRRRSHDRKHSKKKHSNSKCEDRSKSPSDYFDESKFHGSDKSRIRSLKKKYNEYLRHAKKFKHEEEKSKHIEKFVALRSKLKGDETSIKQTDETNIDYEKEEEKFLRSLETYLEIKKKQEKSISLSSIPSTNIKEYNPAISSEGEEYVPENFTPEDLAVNNVEEYNPCNEDLANHVSFTYQPTKIDEYEPVLPQLDEEYCPMPVESAMNATYNPTKKFPGKIIAQTAQQHAPAWMNPPAQFGTVIQPMFPNVRNKRGKLKLVKNKQPMKVISKNTVFIGNIVNPFALQSKSHNLVPTKPMPTANPSSNVIVDKSKIMSKLVHEKLLEIEKKKIELLEEINRKKSLQIKEQCDEVALRKLEKRKSDLMLKIFNSNMDEIPDEWRNDQNVKNRNNVEQNQLSFNYNVNQVSNAFQIKAEDDKAICPENNDSKKLNTLEKEKVKLMLKLKEKLSANSRFINKEKAELEAKMKALEKKALLTQVNHKKGEETEKVFVKVEKNVEELDPPSFNSTAKSTCYKQVIIKQEEETVMEPSNINDKLNVLEKEKAKLLAQIASKSNKGGAVPSEKPKLKILKPEALDEKLGKLAREKEMLIQKIAEKNDATNKRTQNLLETRIRQENFVNNVPVPKLKQEPIETLTSQSTPITKLDQQNVVFKSNGRNANSIVNKKKTTIIRNTKPNAIVELASQVKLKVNQQLSEINKKKMELMKQITAKTSISANVTESDTPVKSLSVEDKLQELEKKKLKLLQEIERKSKETICDKENDERKAQDNNTDAPVSILAQPVFHMETENDSVYISASHNPSPSGTQPSSTTVKNKSLEISDNQLESQERLFKVGVGKFNKLTRKPQQSRMKPMMSQRKKDMRKLFRARSNQCKLTKNNETLNIDVADFQTPYANDNCSSQSSDLTSEISEECSKPEDFSESSDDIKAKSDSSLEQSKENTSNDLNVVLDTPFLTPANSIAEVVVPSVINSDLQDDVDTLFSSSTCVNEGPVVDSIDLDISFEHSNEAPAAIAEQSKVITIDEVCDPGKHDHSDRYVEHGTSPANVELDNEYITLKVIKVEKPDDLDYNNEGNDNERKDSAEHEEDERGGENDRNDSQHFSNTDDTGSSSNNTPVPGENHDQSDNIKTIKLKGNTRTQLDATNDVFVVGEKVQKQSLSNRNSSGKLSTLRASIKHSPSPVVSRLILNNKRKLISASVRKSYLSAKSSMLKSVRGSIKSSSSNKNYVFRNTSEILAEQRDGFSRFTYVKSPVERKAIENRYPNKREKNVNLVERKFRKNPSRYKFENVKYKNRENNQLINSTDNVASTSWNMKSSPKQGKKFIKARNVSVITKYNVVLTRTNSKLTKKTLPPCTRRQMSRFKLSNTSSPSSKYKMSRVTHNSVQSSQNHTAMRNVKSTYKGSKLRGSDSLRTKQESQWSGQKIPSATPLRNNWSFKCPTFSASPSQRLVSKYKMIRISNQRERNKMNLSQRGHQQHNRSLKLIKLHGSSYNVSSRSLKRKLSSTSCLSPSKPLASPCITPVSRKLVKAQDNGKIFSNRNLMGRYNLTSSRLRSRAVLTSRLRRQGSTPILESQRGFLKAFSLHTSTGKRNSKYYHSNQAYPNLSYKSAAEVLRLRRTSRHRASHRQRAARKYSCVSVPSSLSSTSNLPIIGRYANDDCQTETKYSPLYSDLSNSGNLDLTSDVGHSSDPSVGEKNSASELLRYFTAEDPRSNITPADDECVETVIPRQARPLATSLSGFIPL